MRMKLNHIPLAFGLCAVVTATAALAIDSPGFRGADRTGVSKETGLLKSWPQGGPRLVWKTENLGDGHATPSVAAGKIYGMGVRGGDEVVWALDEKTGKELWSTKIAERISVPGRQGGDGSRSTPTVDGNRIYMIGVAGDLVCLDASSGKSVWQKNLVRDYGGEIPRWGYSESPLIDGEKLIATPGGSSATIVALNKSTGAPIWSSKIDGGRLAYSSCIPAEFNGKRQYIQFLGPGVVGVDAATGAELWTWTRPACRTGINCSTPIYRDGHVFASAAYGHGSTLGKLKATGSTISCEEVYFTRDLMSHHGGIVLVGDHVYGFSDPSALVCLDWKTGSVKWSDRSVGKGSVTVADGMIYARSEDGPVALVEATPTGYVEKGRFEQPDRSRAKAWPYPVVANGRLLIRDQGVLLCYDVRQAAASR